MKNSACIVRAHIRNAVLCGLLTFGLAACGADQGSSSSSTAAADPIPSLVSPSVGLLERTSNTAAVTASTPAPGSTTSASIITPTVGTPADAGTTPVADSSSTPTVASNNNPPATPGTPVNSNTPATGTATLDWMPPTENTDGSVLTTLTGYTVYYGTSASNLAQSVKITNPGLTAYTLSNLPSGTWYFAVTSTSSGGTESARSGVVSTTI